jgi:hypothetical protein
MATANRTAKSVYDTESAAVTGSAAAAAAAYPVAQPVRWGFRAVADRALDHPAAATSAGVAGAVEPEEMKKCN